MLIGGAANKQQLTDAWMLNMGAANLSWAPHTGAALNSGRAWHSAHMLQTNQVHTCLAASGCTLSKGIFIKTGLSVS